MMKLVTVKLLFSLCLFHLKTFGSTTTYNNNNQCIDGHSDYSHVKKKEYNNQCFKDTSLINDVLDILSTASKAMNSNDYPQSIKSNQTNDSYIETTSRQLQEEETPLGISGSNVGDSCSDNSFYRWDSSLINKESSVALPDQSLLKCQVCSKVIPGCSTCSSSDICSVCDSSAFSFTQSDGKKACFYDFCGWGKGVDGSECKTCTIQNCQECQFNSSEVCSHCYAGYVLSDQQCVLQSGSFEINFYVLPFEGYKATSEQLTKINSVSAGTTLEEPFYFIQQVQYYLKTRTNLRKYSTVNVQVYLGKGQHFLFSCAQDGYNSDMSGNSNVTDFCNEIESLQKVYHDTDNFKISIQPLWCNMTAQFPSNQAVFNQFCTQSSIETFVNQIDKHTYFNVTNSMRVSGIIFNGQSQSAIYTSTGKLVREFPYTFCTYSFSNDTFTKTLPNSPFEYDCQQHDTYTECSTVSNTRCNGDPYSSSYFKEYVGIAAERHSALFVLYAFDSNHTQSLKTPSLRILNSQFQNFVHKTQEALILVQTLNLWRVVYNTSDGNGTMRKLGTDTGTNITIFNSTFQYMRLCKGMIVYRPQPANIKTGTLNYQQESGISNSCVDCGIYIRNSTFKWLNYKNELRAIRPLYDLVETQRKALRLDSSGLTAAAMMVPLFQNYGALLNVQDFEGNITFVDNVIEKNMINFPDLQFVYQDTNDADADYNQLNTYLNSYENNYQTLYCTTGLSTGAKYRLIPNGISAYASSDYDSLFNMFERHSIILISRPKYEVQFTANNFTDNIAFFGGAITISSPDYISSKSIAIKMPPRLPTIYTSSNTFKRNMAYLSGNAIYVRMTRQSQSQFCGKVIMAYDKFSENFGTKISSGTVSIVCQSVNSASADYGAASQLASNTDEKSDFSTLNFTNNYVGRKGSALYLKQIRQNIITSSFIQNGAVDAVRERKLLPVYTAHLISQSAGLPNRYFTYFNFNSSCGNYEYNDVDSCLQASGRKVFESAVQGAIFIQGPSREGLSQNFTDTTIAQCNFTGNDVGNPFFQKNLASCLFVVNPQSLSITQTVFYNHNSGLINVGSLPLNLTSYMPPSYFSSAHAPLIRFVFNVAQSNNVSINIGSNTKFQENIHHQIMTSKQGEDPQTFDASLISVTSLVSTVHSFIFNNIEVTRNQVVGNGASLFSFTGVYSVNIRNSLFQKNGVVSASIFNTSVAQRGLSLLRNQPLSQAQGIFSATQCGVFVSEINTFKWNAATTGTAYTIYNTPFYANTNTYLLHVSTSGSIAVIAGTGAFKSFIVIETITNVLGTAYVISCADDQHLSLHYFSEIKITSIMSEDVSSFNLKKIGGFYLTKSTITNLVNDTSANMIQKFVLSDNQVYGKVWDQAYLATRLKQGNINVLAGVINAIDAYYLGGVPNFEVNGRNFGILNSINYNKHIWFVDTIFQNHIGNASGVITASNSYIYMKTSDGSFNLPLLPGVRRRLATSQYKISGNTASLGSGVISATKGNITLEGVYFTQNKGTLGGGVLLSQSLLYIKGSTFISNTGTLGGTIYSSFSSYNIDTSSFQKNNAVKASLVYTTGQGTLANYIGSVQVSQNAADYSIILLIDSSLTLSGTYFNDNFSKKGSNGINAVGSTLTISKVQALQTIKKQTSEVTVDSGFIMLSYASQLTMTTSQINNQQGLLAGAIYIIGGSTATISSTKFISNQVINGAIIDVNTGSLNLNAVTMNLNTGGTNIQISSSALTIQASSLSNSNQQLIKAIASSVTADSTTFASGGSVDQLGGGIYIEGPLLQVSGCTFQDLKAASGAAIYLVGSNTGLANIRGNTFLRNQAQQGGAISIETVNLLYLDSNVFQQNQALIIAPVSKATDNLPIKKAVGGAIFSYCQPVYNAQCKVFVTKNTFDNNLAQNWGDTLLYINNPIIMDKTNIFVGNSANEDKLTSGTFNLTLRSVSNGDPLLTPAQRKSQLKMNQFNVVSGVPLNFQYLIIDKFNNTVTDENQATAKFGIFLKPVTLNVTLLGSISIAQNGIIDFSSFIIEAKPGSRMVLELLFNVSMAIDVTTTRYQIDVQVRNCTKGEFYTLENTCQICPYGTFSFDYMTSPKNCSECQEGSICYGKDVIAPIENYWRPSIDQAEFLPCLNKKACLGGNETNQKGTCSIGYKGPLCSQCSDGYYQRHASHLCTECPDPTTQRIQFTFILVFASLLISFLVVLMNNVNWDFARTFLNQLPAVFKIFAVHLQLVWFFTEIQIYTSEDKIFESITYIQLWMKYLIEGNGRCIFQEETGEQLNVMRSIWFVAPLVLYIFTLFVLFATFKSLRQPDLVFKNMAIQSFFIIFYFTMMHTFYKTMSVFTCVDLQGENVLEEDRSVICSGSEYSQHVLPAVVSFFFWVLLVPITQFAILFRSRKKLIELGEAEWSVEGLTSNEIIQNYETNLRFSVTINGYDSRRYFWDFVNMIQMLIMVLTYVGMKSMNYLQAIIILSLIIIMAAFMALDLLAAPYVSVGMNFLKSLSSISIIGLLLGELTELQKQNTGFKAVANFFGFVPQISFYLYLLVQLKRRIFYRSTKNRRTIGIGLVYFDIDLQKYDRNHIKNLAPGESHRALMKSSYQASESEIQEEDEDRESGQIKTSRLVSEDALNLEDIVIEYSVNEGIEKQKREELPEKRERSNSAEVIGRKSSIHRIPSIKEKNDDVPIQPADSEDNTEQKSQVTLTDIRQQSVDIDVSRIQTDRDKPAQSLAMQSRREVSVEQVAIQYNNAKSTLNPQSFSKKTDKQRPSTQSVVGRSELLSQPMFQNFVPVVDEEDPKFNRFENNMPRFGTFMVQEKKDENVSLTISPSMISIDLNAQKSEDILMSPLDITHKKFENSGLRKSTTLKFKKLA